MSARKTHPARFEDRAALITGGANGIGRACAQLLASQGATVGLIDLDGEKSHATASEIAAGGATAIGYGVDVTDADRVREAFDDFEQRAGRIDILVNMAGLFPQIPFDELKLEDWKRIVAVNLDGTFITCHDVMPRMRKHGYGRITTVSSGTVHLGRFSSAAYIAAKSGVIGLTHVLAREGGPDGITANVIMPGVIMSERGQATGKQAGNTMMDYVLEQQCIKRFGQPEDIAAAVEYATSESAGFLTGQTLNIGGGWTYV